MFLFRILLEFRFLKFSWKIPASIYLLKVNGVFILVFENISQVVPVFLLLTLSR